MTRNKNHSMREGGGELCPYSIQYIFQLYTDSNSNPEDYT